MTRSLYVIGNWKMHKTINEAVNFINDFSKSLTDQQHAYLAVPFTALSPSAKIAEQNGSLHIGAQNMHDVSEGAFTGEVSAMMLKEAGASFVLLGHSERRQYFNESNAFINAKIKKALSEGIQPVLCIGESIEERESGKTMDILNTQLSECLDGVDAEAMASIVIAYEPVWAIGSGLSASPEIAQETASSIREQLSAIYSKDISDLTSLLYGGSVKVENVNAYVNEKDIDGVLVGGASLNEKVFAEIVKTVYNSRLVKS